jgi:hypothetical protein
MGENTEFLKNSAAKTRILFRGLFAAAILIVIVILAACFLTWRVNQDVNSISVSTDKQEYQVGDIVRISIQNSGDRSMDIYCPMWCARSIRSRPQNCIDKVYTERYTFL